MNKPKPKEEPKPKQEPAANKMDEEKVPEGAAQDGQKMDLEFENKTN